MEDNDVYNNKIRNEAVAENVAIQEKNGRK